MNKEVTEIAIGAMFEFTLRNKQTLQGKFIKEYLYKGTVYFQIKSESGKKYLINPKNAKQL